jgi:hypothetical protein
MTVVIDPLGSPDIHFQRDGVAVLEMEGGTSLAPTIIPAIAGKVVVIATTAGHFKVSDDFSIGDAVEIGTTLVDTSFLHTPEGSTVIGAASTPIGFSIGSILLVWRATQSVWMNWSL